MNRPLSTVLVNPPLWNAYAPHLAVPLLVGTLRARGLPAIGYDLSISCLDWLLSPSVLEELRDKVEQTPAKNLEQEWVRQRALLVAMNAAQTVDEAKATLRSSATLADEQRQRWARRSLRDAMWLVSAAFPGTEFDLVCNRTCYSPESTRQVLAAATDAELNPYRWAFDRMLDWPLLDDPQVGLIGVSISADTQLVAAMTFLAMLRERREDVHVVLGGNFATRMVERWVVPHPFLDLIDTVLVGEGEESLPALVEALPQLPERSGNTVLAADPRSDIPGAVWRADQELRRTASRSVDIRKSAMPAFGDLPLDKYFAPGPILPVFGSRSCAWDCAFCSIPFASSSFRQRPAANVVAEMRTLQNEYSTSYFMFVDEIMTPRTLDTVSAELIRTGTKLWWYGETRFAGGLTDGLVRQLYDSGCRRMNFGLESSSQRVLDLMRKGTRTEHILTNVKAMLSAGVPIHLFVIHGFPGETREEAEDTISFAEDVVRVSRQHYGIPYTTWGGSPFVLDVHSPIGTSPSSFGVITRRPHPDDDLALMRDYDTSAGLTQRQSLQIATVAAGTRAFRAPVVWFRAAQDPTAREVEELTFLRACLGAPMPGPPETPALDWPPPAGTDRMTVAPGIITRRLPWQATEQDSGASVALYEPYRDRFLQLHWPVGIDLPELSGLTWAELTRWVVQNRCTFANQPAVHTATLLLRHGFVEVIDRHPEPVAWRWRPELGVATQRTAGRTILTNPITGLTVRLNDEAAEFWRLLMCAESAGPIPGSVTNDDKPAAAPQPLVSSLARYGMLVREVLALGDAFGAA